MVSMEQNRTSNCCNGANSDIQLLHYQFGKFASVLETNKPINLLKAKFQIFEVVTCFLR